MPCWTLLHGQKLQGTTIWSDEANPSSDALNEYNGSEVGALALMQAHDQHFLNGLSRSWHFRKIGRRKMSQSFAMAKEVVMAALRNCMRENVVTRSCIDSTCWLQVLFRDCQERLTNYNASCIDIDRSTFGHSDIQRLSPRCSLVGKPKAFYQSNEIAARSARSTGRSHVNCSHPSCSI